MDYILKEIDYKKVFYYFEEISNVPRGSGNNKGISDYLVSFAKKRNLKYVQDEALNVIIYKDASDGCENVESFIIQAHMDMVCEKKSESTHDFTKEGLNLYIEGGYIKAKDTTLGADDGIGVAYALAILDDDSIKHPAFEVLITTDEEIGMLGANALKNNLLKGKYMINIDSEEEGSILNSCAGGMEVEGLIELGTEKISGTVVRIDIMNLIGGHSGNEIHKNGENATCLMARILSSIKKEIKLNIVNIIGGQKDNVIPSRTSAVIVVPDNTNINIIEGIVSDIIDEIKSKEAAAEYTISYEDKTVMSFDDSATDKVIWSVLLSPNGVQNMSPYFEGLVESSLNLGIYNADAITETVKSVYLLRSSVSNYLTYMYDRIDGMYSLLGGKCKINSQYPAWTYVKDSKLREYCIDAFVNKYNKMPKIEAIHAGLECGILAGKIDGADIVSFGPDILDIHTINERLDIESTKRVYDYTLAVIERIVIDGKQ